MLIDVSVETDVSRSARARQLEGMFDVPAAPHQQQRWEIDAPIEDRDWQIGLIVGPSGAGKSTILRESFGSERNLRWKGDSVIDAFSDRFSMSEIAAVCQAVGFNTIPAWLRPHAVLSNGEKFRVHMARLLLEAKADETIIVDEFTSVVDRQVAQIGAHAVNKYVRRNDRRFVAATCHYDVIDWLQPDWVIDAALREFRWRSVQPRPRLDVSVSAVDYSAWQLFAPFHYLTSELNRSARCFVLSVNGEPAAFAGVLHRPHYKAKNIKGMSRLVTLPDWQGLGLAFVLCDTVAAAYKARGMRYRSYPAHPSLIRAFDRSDLWKLRQLPGMIRTNHNYGPQSKLTDTWKHGQRPCAVFEYIGPPADDDVAHALLDDDCTE